MVPVISKCVNHHSLWSGSFTCDNNENDFINGVNLVETHCINIRVVSILCQRQWNFGQTETAALECLVWTFKILTQLGFWIGTILGRCSKGTFGSLAILKTIADGFCYASVDTFKALKIFFFTCRRYLYKIRSCICGVLPFARKASSNCGERSPWTLNHYLRIIWSSSPRSIQFFWNMRALLKETLSIIAVLNEEHLQEMPKWRYTYCPFPTLAKLVNPLILKLVHEEDSTGMADTGPFYTLIAK